MADVVDQANDYIEAQLARAIRAARGVPGPAVVRHVRCPDCHEPLADHRRSAGICVPCLEVREARGRFAL